MFIAAGLTAVVFVSKKTPEQHISIAEELIKQGEHSAAITELGKAVHKDPRNLDASLAMLEAIRITPVERVTIARELVSNEWGLLQNLAEFHRDRPEFREQYFQHLFDDLGARANGYARLYEAANTRLQNAPDDETARRYRSIAVALAPTHYPTPSVQSQTTKDLKQVVADNPNDGLALHSQASWALHLAEQDRRAGASSESLSETGSGGNFKSARKLPI